MITSRLPSITRHTTKQLVFLPVTVTTAAPVVAPGGAKVGPSPGSSVRSKTIVPGVGTTRPEPSSSKVSGQPLSLWPFKSTWSAT